MIPVHPRLNVVFFKFSFICKTFFPRVYFLKIYVTLQNFAKEKWRQKVAKNLRGFIFYFFWNLVFMWKGSQPRIYTELLRFQLRVEDPKHIIVLMQSIIPIFIHSFHVLTLVLRTRKMKDWFVWYLISDIKDWYLIKTMIIFCLRLFR